MERPEPAVGPDDVKIRVHRAGLCGTDLHLEQWDDWASSVVKPPLVIGHEFFGEVVEIGQDVTSVKVGQKAALSIDAYPNTKFEGTVTEVGSSPISKTDPDLLTLTANSEAINFKVKIRVDNPPETIRPGFSVTADIVTGRREGATAIPIQALIVRDVPTKEKKAAAGTRPETEEGVYIVKDGKLGFEKVDTGIAGELMIEVKKGPAVGQEIVTGPFKVLRQVKEGDKVIIEKETGDGKKDEAKPA